MRGSVFHATETLVTEVCSDCHILFAIPMSLKDRRLEDKKSFYCPNGHCLHYTGKTEAEKLREELERAQTNLIRERNWRNDAEARVEEEKRRHASTKGVLTKTKKRIAAGVCPCCKRSFSPLAEHMKKQHPDYVPEETVS